MLLESRENNSFMILPLKPLTIVLLLVLASSPAVPFPLLAFWVIMLFIFFYLGFAPPDFTHDIGISTHRLYLKYTVSNLHFKNFFQIEFFTRLESISFFSILSFIFFSSFLPNKKLTK